MEKLKKLRSTMFAVALSSGIFLQSGPSMAFVICQKNNDSRYVVVEYNQRSESVEVSLSANSTEWQYKYGSSLSELAKRNKKSRDLLEYVTQSGGMVKISLKPNTDGHYPAQLDLALGKQHIHWKNASCTDAAGILELVTND